MVTWLVVAASFGYHNYGSLKSLNKLPKHGGFKLKVSSEVVRIIIYGSM